MILYQEEDLVFTKSIYSKRPPKALSFLLIFILLLIIFLITCSMYMKKSYIVNAEGTVMAKEIQYISTHSYGNISSIQKNEGDMVHVGDTLLELNDGTNNSDLNKLSKQKSIIQKEIEAINLFVKSLDYQSNMLNKDDIYQSEYYQKMQYYLSIVSDENKLIQSQNILLERRQAKLNSLIKEKKKIKDKAELKGIESEINAIEEEVMSIKSNLDTGTTQSKQIYYQMLIDAETKQSELNNQLKEIQEEMKKVKGIENLKKIKSNGDGNLHYLVDIKKGNTIAEGQVIGSIIPKDSELYIEVFVYPHDITKIKVGEKCQIEITGTNTAKYGTIDGKIVHIDSGTINKETGQGISSFYKVEVEIDSTILKDEDHKIVLTPYMNVKARIIYDQESYFDWFLEKVNLK